MSKAREPLGYADAMKEIGVAQERIPAVRGYLHGGIIDPFGSLSRLKQHAVGKATREDHSQIMNAMIRLYSGAVEAQKKQAMAFELSLFEQKLLEFGTLFRQRFMDIRVSLGVLEALDLCWRTLAEMISVVRNRRLLAQAALANYVCVPIAAVGLLRLFRAQPMVAAGFLIAAVCPGASYGPPFTALAKGNVAASVGLMVVLAGSSAVLAPLLLGFLLTRLGGGSSLSVDAGKMALTLLVTQLLPLCVGLVVRQWRPHLAGRLLEPANRLSVVLNLSAIGLILAVQFQSLTAIRPMAFVGMLALVLPALVAGWVLGMPDSRYRTRRCCGTLNPTPRWRAPS